MAREDSYVLTLDGLELHPITSNDVDDLHALFLGSDFRRYLLDGEEMPRDWVVGVVADSERLFAAEGCGLWKMIDPSGRLAGIVGIREFFDPPRKQLIYGLRRRAWGCGHATRASARVLDYLFDELDWHRVEAATDAPNEASIRVLQRLDFESFHPDPAPAGVGPEDTKFFELGRTRHKKGGRA